MWMDVVRKFNKKNIFSVKMMTQNDILNVSNFLQNVTKAKKLSVGHRLILHQL